MLDTMVIDDDRPLTRRRGPRPHLAARRPLCGLRRVKGWLGGYVGVYRNNSVTTGTQFDDFKVGIDGNADGDFDDSGDEIVISDDFSSNTTSLTYDNNGNLTDDGIFAFVYDAWNRLVKAKHRRPTGSGAAASTVKAIEYLGDNRLATQTISNSGTEASLHDGGNRTDERYYAFGRLAESRNGSNQTVQQVLWDAASVGGRTVVWIESNGDATIGNDTTPDTVASGESSETPADARYFVHVGPNGGAVALSLYDSNGTNNGRVVARHASQAHGRLEIFNGDSGSGELGSSNLVATESLSLYIAGYAGSWWLRLPDALSFLDNELDQLAMLRPTPTRCCGPSVPYSTASCCGGSQGVRQCDGDQSSAYSGSEPTWYLTPLYDPVDRRCICYIFASARCRWDCTCCSEGPPAVSHIWTCSRFKVNTNLSGCGDVRTERITDESACERWCSGLLPIEPPAGNCVPACQ